ncbi:substrate-binding periplasmic protein [Caedibacter taeniospiralis]|jgi:hypothetical protein|uniref:substrate-binding periplasmic protein n=1 Tax=Caedibacter taeniospiralis TaxID=28907 RepID=UPI0037BE2CF2
MRKNRQTHSYLKLLSLTWFIVPAVVGAQANGSTLKFCVEPWPPYDYKHDGNLLGSDVERNKKLFTQLKLELQVHIMPWKQCWKLVQAGKMDGALMVSKKTARAPYVYYPRSSMAQVNYVWVSNKNHEKQYFDLCPNLSALNIKIGLVKDNSYSSELLRCLAKPYNNERIETYNTLEQALRMLIINKIQLIPAIPEMVEHLAQDIKLEGIVIHPTPIFGKTYYTVFSKNSSFKNAQYPSIKALSEAFDNLSLKDTSDP